MKKQSHSNVFSTELKSNILNNLSLNLEDNNVTLYDGIGKQKCQFASWILSVCDNPRYLVLTL